MMVDGVSQNYYGSAPSSVSHGGVPSSQFGALIDPNFIIGVDVSRGNVVGGDGVNALAGSANFRTIGVDDVVFAGEKRGRVRRCGPAITAWAAAPCWPWA